MNLQSNHQRSRTDATTDRAGSTRDQEFVSGDGPGAAAARTTPDPAAEIAALAAEGPHLITSWSARGAVHRSCSCGRSTPAAGVLTAATAEGFVAKCRAAQDEREAARDRAAQRTTAGATPAAPAPSGPGAGTGTPGTAETISAPPPPSAADLLQGIGDACAWLASQAQATSDPVRERALREALSLMRPWLPQ